MKIVSKIHRLFVKPKPKPKRKYVKRVPMAQVRNNDERIESLRFSVHALRVGVLEYAPGQLTTNNAELDGKTVRLYYPPESVSDKKFLKSLETAPVVVGGHDSTTNEHNKKIDGWAHTINYDENGRCAMIAGVVKGNKEVAYIRSNLGTPDFGASAFVDIYNLVIESGTTPDGQVYDAIAKDLKATHVALAPHVRDPKNKIQLYNTVVINTDGKYNNEVKKMDSEIDINALASMIATEVRNAITVDKRKAEIVEIKNAISELEASIKALKVKNANHSCENCNHWIDATAECEVALKYESNGNSVPTSIEKALDLDKNKTNNCSYFS